MAMSGRGAGVVIVGGGHAGGRTAERLRHGGFVGPIDVVGAEPELPYERPPLSKSVLTSPKASNAYLLPQARWNEAGVRFHLGVEAVEIDRAGRTVKLSDGGTLAYRKLVLATGVSPRRLPMLSILHDRVLHLRSFADAITLRERITPDTSLVLIGAGFIGLEVAASAARMGAKVTVVEAADRPLARLLPSYFSAWLADVHRRAGIDILCGRQIVAVEPDGQGAALRLDDGACLAADMVLAGVGSLPNDGLARAAGLAVEDGIPVNAYCQTDDPDIFAVGDVARHRDAFAGSDRRLESWKNAEDTAAVAAACICGSPVRYAEVPWFWTDQHELNIQIAGTLIGEPAYERGRPGERAYLAYFVEQGRLIGAIGIGCGRDIRIARETIKAGTRLDAADLAGKGFSARLAPGSERQAS
ncbi:MAG: FAD-dependent oxidoreductase [Rhizobiaceae bacterium]|nr:FAD-dependent oxidoreductase [Rhizobiaceae bacterium]